jgi:putative flippase GtrA
LTKAGLQLGSLYALFAGLATLANLLTQWSVFRLCQGSHCLLLGIAAGTIVGLVVKYDLDKRWIFEDRVTGVGQHARKFSLYSLTGVFTTAIFWTTELAFATIGELEVWRYIGAILGLALGYSLKFLLDRRFVFANSVEGQTNMPQAN